MVELCLQIVFKTNLKSISSKFLVQNISESSRYLASGDRCHLDTVGNISANFGILCLYQYNDKSTIRSNIFQLFLKNPRAQLY